MRLAGLTFRSQWRWLVVLVTAGFVLALFEPAALAASAPRHTHGAAAATKGPRAGAGQKHATQGKARHGKKPQAGKKARAGTSAHAPRATKRAR
jgi:hypothetical protein